MRVLAENPEGYVEREARPRRDNGDRPRVVKVATTVRHVMKVTTVASVMRTLNVHRVVITVTVPAP